MTHSMIKNTVLVVMTLTDFRVFYIKSRNRIRFQLFRISYTTRIAVDMFLIYVINIASPPLPAG